jgi:hypothetical protein
MRTVREIADELYQLPPARFVAARNAEAAALKTAGDRAGAAELAALRRPTVVAWLVNMLALRRPALVADWFTLGDAMRSAQTGLDGGEVRRLAERRRTILAELLRQVGALAATAGHTGALPVSEISTTFTTALADPEAGELMRTGRLLTAASYAGFGQQPEETWGAAAPVDSGDSAEPGAAEAALARAEADLALAAEDERAAQRHLDELTEQLADLEERVREAQRLRREATTARHDAERAVIAARRHARTKK